MKLWSPTVDEDNEGFDGFPGDSGPTPECLTDAMIVRALYICDGLVTAAVGYLRGHYGIWVSRPWLVRRIDNTPIIKTVFDSFGAARRDMCEELIMVAVRKGSVRAAMWYLERVHPETFGANRVTQPDAATTGVVEVPVTELMSQDQWQTAFAGMRRGGAPNSDLVN